MAFEGNPFMPEFDRVIKGGTVATADWVARTDIGIKDGRIAALGGDLGADDVVDATDRIVTPGGIDSHAHVEQRGAGGAVNVDSFASGTASAAAGGTTTLICFALQEAGRSMTEAVADYRALAGKGARVDYAFHLLVTDPHPGLLAEMPALIEAGNRSIKIFTTYPDAKLEDEEVLAVFALAAREDVIVCVHAEHDRMIAWQIDRLLAAGKTAPRYHAAARPMLAEAEAVHRVCAMAELTGARIQVFHLSGAASTAEIERAQARGVRVAAETCTHYLTLTAQDLDRPGFEGAKFICSPPLRTAADQEALWRFMRRGVIANVTSDHSPNDYDSPLGKMIHGPEAPFTVVPNGVPGLAARMPVLFSEGVGKGRIGLEQFVALTSTNSARLFGLHPRKGTIAPGADADLVLWDPHRKITLTNALMQHAGDYTPYEGMTITGWPTTTLLRGQTIMQNDKILGAPGTGVFLKR